MWYHFVMSGKPKATAVKQEEVRLFVKRRIVLAVPEGPLKQEFEYVSTLPSFPVGGLASSLERVGATSERTAIVLRRTQPSTPADLVRLLLRFVTKGLRTGLRSGTYRLTRPSVSWRTGPMGGAKQPVDVSTRLQALADALLPAPTPPEIADLEQIILDAKVSRPVDPERFVALVNHVLERTNYCFVLQPGGERSKRLCIHPGRSRSKIIEFRLTTHGTRGFLKHSFDLVPSHLAEESASTR